MVPLSMVMPIPTNIELGELLDLTNSLLYFLNYMNTLFSWSPTSSQDQLAQTGFSHITV